MVSTKSAKKSLAPYDLEIVPSVSKQIGTKQLVSRLLDLADHLSALDQSNVSTDLYNRIAGDLASKKLLHHLNQTVQALTCCCLADVFRIYAPEAPYSESDLSTIFKAFFQQLSLSWDQDNTNFQHQSYLLTRLVEVRSIILIVDLPDASDLISTLFDTIYTLAAKGFPPKLEHLAADMLAEVISEANTTPKHVVDLVFLRLTNDASSLTSETSNISNPGFVFSVAVCEANTDKMSRLLAQLYSEILDESVQARNGTEATKGKLFKALEKIHKWSVSIWRHVPELLTPVMGLINDELNSDSDKIRALATSTIGSMLATSPEMPGSVNINSNISHFVSLHNATWTNWLRKSSDISPHVRSTWVEDMPAIFASSSVTSEMLNELRIGFSKCLLDSSEKVRLSAATSVESMPFAIFTKRLCTKLVLETLSLLLREKDELIRNKVIRSLSYVYDNYMRSKQDQEVVDFGNLEPHEVKETENFIAKEFPNHLLHLNYINMNSITTSVDLELFENLLPFQSSSQKRVNRLCKLYEVLDTKSRHAFFAIISRQQKYAHAVNKFIELTEPAQGQFDKENVEYKESKEKTKEQVEPKVEKILTWLSASLPETFNAYQSFQRIFLSDNRRIFKLLSNCVSENLDYKTIKNSIKEMIIKLSDNKTIKLDSKKNSLTREQLISSIKLLLYRASPIFFNQSNVTELINLSKKLDDPMWKTSNELLELISSKAPLAMSDHIKTLVENFVMQKDDDLGGLGCSLLRLIHHALKTSPSEFPEDPRFVDKLLRLANKGSPQQAKYSIKILGHHEHKENYLSEVVDKVLPLNCSDLFFATHVASIAEIALILPVAIEHSTNEINRIITEEVLRKNRSEVQLSYDWLSEEDLYEKYNEHGMLNEKLFAIRYIVNRLRALGRAGKFSDNGEAQSLVAKPIKLLSMVIVTGGELVRNLPPTPEPYKGRIQLAAALGILKLAKLPCFNSLISCEVMLRLGKIVFDLRVEVRKHFGRQLQRYLSTFAISEKFLDLNFLYGHEPEKELKEEVAVWVRSYHKKMVAKGEICVESCLSRLIHAIAHDERFFRHFGEEKEEYDNIQGYEYALNFFLLFLNSVANESNISLIYYVASRVKQHKDALLDPELYKQENLPSNVENLYRSAELCQLILKHYSDQKGWNLQTWPGKLKLPLDTFALMDDVEEANRIILKVYIADDIQLSLFQYFKQGQSSRELKRKGAPIATSKPNKKRRTPTKKAKPAKRNNSTTPEPENQVIRRSSRARKQVKYSAEDESEEEASEEQEDYDDDDDLKY